MKTNKFKDEQTFITSYLENKSDIQHYGKINVYVNTFDRYDSFPVDCYLATREALEICLISSKGRIVHTNHPDVISTFRLIHEVTKRPIEFFLDDVSQGVEIDRIFEYMNSGLDLAHIIYDFINKEQNNEL